MHGEKLTLLIESSGFQSRVIPPPPQGIFDSVWKQFWLSLQGGSGGGVVLLASSG